jgi:hypothetical protein
MPGMSLPVVPVVQPSSIANVPTNLLVKEKHFIRKFFPGVGYSWLHPTAARCWDAMNIALFAALKVWLTITSTADALRSYQTQVNAFNTRYTAKWTLAESGLTNLTQNTRKWNGTPANSGPGVLVKYYLRKGQIPCAVPGTGWHPRGLALDNAVYDASLNDGNVWPGGARHIRSNKAAFDWLKLNVTEFGFSWENEKEYVDDPHLRYTAGDKIPQRVIDIEKYLAAQKPK